MNTQTLLAYSLVAFLAILSPGPAVLLALRNGAAFGVRSVVWSSLGNISGLFVLSSAAMLGLGALLESSAAMFMAVKLLGALYLFYIGIRHVWGNRSVLGRAAILCKGECLPSRRALYREGCLLAVTNPKPILFFTALFPQFIHVQTPLLEQFVVLTGIFMILSFLTLMTYAALAGRARRLLIKPRLVQWINGVVGMVFIGFGAALLAFRRATN